MVAIVPPDHRFAKQRSVRADQLFEEPMIGGEMGTGAGATEEAFWERRLSDAYYHEPRKYGSGQGGCESGVRCVAGIHLRRER
jgi:hypothetical protein